MRNKLIINTMPIIIKNIESIAIISHLKNQL
jgi:hypothetical protein